MLSASAFVVNNEIDIKVSVTVNGKTTPVVIPAGQSATIPIATSEFPAGTQVSPDVSDGSVVANATACDFEPSAPAATYTVYANEVSWGVSGPTQAS